jgi:hypothetical protein
METNKSQFIKDIVSMENHLKHQKQVLSIVRSSSYINAMNNNCQKCKLKPPAVPFSYCAGCLCSNNVCPNPCVKDFNKCKHCVKTCPWKLNGSYCGTYINDIDCYCSVHYCKFPNCTKIISDTYKSGLVSHFANACKKHICQYRVPRTQIQCGNVMVAKNHPWCIEHICAKCNKNPISNFQNKLCNLCFKKNKCKTCSTKSTTKQIVSGYKYCDKHLCQLCKTTPGEIIVNNQTYCFKCLQNVKQHK